MFNPLEKIRKFQSQIGKPIRPLIELQKGTSIVNILTKTVQTENMINDSIRSDAWEIPKDAIASAIYIDGIFKGMGFFASEEGIILQATKTIDLKDTDGNTISFNAKGIWGKLLDASLIERGSALKPSMAQVIVYCILVGGMAFMAGMSYA